MIECRSIKGNNIKIPKERLSFRPSVYAVLIDNGKILMVKVRSNGKYFFPGGGIDIGEKIEDALKREVMEETGIEIEIGEFIHFREDFFYWDVEDKAYHMFNFFYVCKPVTTKLVRDEEVDDDEAMEPRWVDIDKVKNTKDNLGAVDEIFKLLSL